MSEAHSYNELAITRYVEDAFICQVCSVVVLVSMVVKSEAPSSFFCHVKSFASLEVAVKVTSLFSQTVVSEADSDTDGRSFTSTVNVLDVSGQASPFT